MTTINEYEHDAAATTGTRYSIEPSDIIQGELISNQDKDWFRITLHKGITYEIRLSDLTQGQISLKNENAVTVQGSNAEINGARLVINPAESATYYIEIHSNNQESGSYQIRIEQERPVGTYQDIADYLVEGYPAWEGHGTAEFDISEDTVITVNLEALTSEATTLAKQAFTAWEAITPLEFQYIDTEADITIRSTIEQGAAVFWTTTGPSQEYIHQASINIPPYWLDRYGYTTDSNGYTTFIHEIGHALGLGHPGPYNGVATWGTDNLFLGDSWQTSIMSYIGQNENDWLDADFAYPVTPMIADIVAIQSIYGAPEHINTGNTVYGYETTIEGYLGDYFSLLTRESDVFTKLLETIEFPAWRGDGATMKLDFYDLDGDGKEDLVMAGVRELVYFRNTGTTENPRFTQDKVNDYGLNDIDIELAFAAPLFHDMNGDGEPELILVTTNGATSPATIRYFEKTNGTFTEQTEDNPFDTISISSYTTLAVGDIDGDGRPDVVTGDRHEGLTLYWNKEEDGRTTFQAASADNNPVANITINGGNPTPDLADLDNDGDLDLISGSGNGRLHHYENTTENGKVVFKENTDSKIGQYTAGGLAAPKVTDFNGDGTLEIVVGEHARIIRWYENTGTATEPVYEPTTLSNPTTFTITDTSGVDTLDFRTDKTDQVINLEEASASDIYGVKGSMVIAPDTIIERVVAGIGNDVVNGNSAANLLRGNSGDDRLYGKTGNDSLYGNSGNDRLNGGLGADTLSGDAGNDYLQGGAGADNLSGGTGSDTASYSGSPAGVTVRLHNDQLEGGDAEGDVFATQVEVPWTDSEGREHTDTLPDIENLMGSDFNDTLAGDRRDNELSGGAGDDTLYGGPGGGDDTINAQDGNDRLFGGQGNDTLHGGQGNDQLSGGPGQDVFVFVPGTYEDTITDFTLGEDKIDLTAFGLENTDNLVTQDAESTVILDPNLLGGVTVIFENLTDSNISDDHFIV